MHCTSEGHGGRIAHAPIIFRVGVSFLNTELVTSRWAASLLAVEGSTVKYDSVMILAEILSLAALLQFSRYFFKHLECAKAVCSCRQHWAGAPGQNSSGVM